MVKYIDKSALIAEIENLLKPVRQRLERDKNDPWDSDIAICMFGEQLTKNINTLEAKEVNLEKELESWRHNHFHGRRDKEASGEYLERVSQLDFAKYFFELGLKAQKGELI